MARDTRNWFDRHLHRRDVLRRTAASSAVIADTQELRAPAAARDATPAAKIDLTKLSVDTFYVEPDQAFSDAKWIFGFSNASETNTWRTALREAIQAGAAKYPNVELLITDANDSPSKQVSDL